VSPNEAEQKASQSASEEAQLEAERANLTRSALQVSDCILRAPFAGEIAQRSIDPGAFVRPGSSIVTVVDRSTVRMTADAPEIDFDLIPPGTKVTVHAYATNRDVSGVISRRAPAADAATRTVHFEIDIADAARSIPVGTTGEVRIEVGTPRAATQVPLYAANVRGSKASMFVVDHDVAHAKTFPVLGEIGGALYLEPKLAAGSAVVTEGRALLEDGDRVEAKLEADARPPGIGPPAGVASSTTVARDVR
jgi:RND family efflux transporter MFP subunit